MQCYQHRGEFAVGVCRGCGKAVCPQCAIDTGVGLACSDACGRQVRVERGLVARSRSAMSGTGRFNMVMGAIFAVPSGLFAILHLLAGDSAAALPWLPFTALGIVFIAWGTTFSRKQRALADEGKAPVLPSAES